MQRKHLLPKDYRFAYGCMVTGLVLSGVAAGSLHGMAGYAVFGGLIVVLSVLWFTALHRMDTR